MPVFFKINSFRCASSLKTAIFVEMLRKSDPFSMMPRAALCLNEPSRIQCLEKLAIAYERFSTRTPLPLRRLAKSLVYLTQSNHLKHVTVYVFDGGWFEDHAWEDEDGVVPRNLYKEPHELPCIVHLVRILHNAEKYEVEGERGKIQEYLENQVVKLKMEGASLDAGDE